MNLDVQKRLHDVRSACQAVIEFTRGKTLSDYESNRMLSSAVERQFEIIGEALSKASDLDGSLPDQIPDLPKIVGLRNRIIHGYDSVDDEIVWDVVVTKIGNLLNQVNDVLKNR